MGYIHKISIGENNTNLIQPLLYAINNEASATNTFTADIGDFTLVSGTAVYIQFKTTNNNEPTLNISNTGAKFIYYNGNKLSANFIKQWHTYNLIYDKAINSNVGGWRISGDFGESTYLPLAGGTLTGALTINDTTETTDSNSGALIVKGGVAIAKNIIANQIKLTGITSATANSNRPIWFAASQNNVVQNGMPAYNSNFTYNPSTKTLTINGATITSTNYSGNAATATALASGKTLKVSLSSTSASTAFDGSANITDIGVDGVLAIANGGTGKSNDASANTVFAGPSSGSNAGAPSWRALVAADIPNLSWNKITTNIPTTLSGYGITDAAAIDHVHGNISNDGKIGTGNNLIVTINGVISAGEAISNSIASQTNTTKFLREDGTWSIPSYLQIGTSATTAMAGNTTVTNVSYTNTTSSNYEYPVLFKNSTSTTTTAAGVRFISATNKSVTINGSTGALTAGGGFIGNLTGNADTSSQISASLATTTKAYLLGTSTTITATAADVSLIGDTNVYLTTTAGELSAVNYSLNVSGTEKAKMMYNSTDDTIDFVFI